MPLTFAHRALCAAVIFARAIGGFARGMTAKTSVAVVKPRPAIIIETLWRIPLDWCCSEMRSRSGEDCIFHLWTGCAVLGSGMIIGSAALVMSLRMAKGGAKETVQFVNVLFTSAGSL
jgi:hypothetical protein